MPYSSEGLRIKAAKNHWKDTVSNIEFYKKRGTIEEERRIWPMAVAYLGLHLDLYRTHALPFLNPQTEEVKDVQDETMRAYTVEAANFITVLEDKFDGSITRKDILKKLRRARDEIAERYKEKKASYLPLEEKDLNVIGFALNALAKNPSVLHYAKPDDFQDSETMRKSMPTMTLTRDGAFYHYRDKRLPVTGNSFRVLETIVQKSQHKEGATGDEIRQSFEVNPQTKKLPVPGSVIQTMERKFATRGLKLPFTTPGIGHKHVPYNLKDGVTVHFKVVDYEKIPLEFKPYILTEEESELLSQVLLDKYGFLPPEVQVLEPIEIVKMFDAKKRIRPIPETIRRERLNEALAKIEVTFKNHKEVDVYSFSNPQGLGVNLLYFFSRLTEEQFDQTVGYLMEVVNEGKAETNWEKLQEQLEEKAGLRISRLLHDDLQRLHETGHMLPHHAVNEPAVYNMADLARTFRRMGNLIESFVTKAEEKIRLDHPYVSGDIPGYSLRDIIKLQIVFILSERKKGGFSADMNRLIESKYFAQLLQKELEKFKVEMQKTRIAANT